MNQKKKKMSEGKTAKRERSGAPKSKEKIFWGVITADYLLTWAPDRGAVATFLNGRAERPIQKLEGGLGLTVLPAGEGVVFYDPAERPETFFTVQFKKKFPIHRAEGYTNIRLSARIMNRIAGLLTREGVRSVGLGSVTVAGAEEMILYDMGTPLVEKKNVLEQFSNAEGEREVTIFSYDEADLARYSPFPLSVERQLLTEFAFDAAEFSNLLENAGRKDHPAESAAILVDKELSIVIEEGPSLIAEDEDGPLYETTPVTYHFEDTDFVPPPKSLDISVNDLMEYLFFFHDKGWAVPMISIYRKLDERHPQFTALSSRSADNSRLTFVLYR